ncbi:MAG: DegT/DnrJ/EryC1/StrS aminotransferase [Candidatus Marinimicrobia bacterium]|nr:DegT/DnrJ/EryC1/StrS aminotransferase [Candidatus Neomarinimicrobiota bacterium]|tara:strand:+ start:5461 stop:6708 length:1248 start_codon:yes stop_codon:yes gene_type:complete
MKNKLIDLIKNNFNHEIYDPNKSITKLQEVTFNHLEIEEAIDSMLSTYVVMGEKTKIFENLWSSWIGREKSVFVNSGSSAILLAMMWLKFKISNNEKNEILIPAVTWSTSLFPAIIVGLKPVLVDVDLSNLCTNSFEKYISDNTIAIMPVHLLGHACNMSKIMKEARKHNLVVIEDCCEAHGTKYRKMKVGTYGDIGIWSSMFAHHISTIEGGMISLDNQELDDLFRMFRAHGWVRDISEESRKLFINNNRGIHPSFLFPELGINVRPTEINASFGIHQMKKIDNFINNRRNAFQALYEQLNQYNDFFLFFPEQEHEYFSPFAFPILIRESAPFDRSQLLNHLSICKIEHRPIAGSNLAQQPFMEHYSSLINTSHNLYNAEKINDLGFFIGLNHKTDELRINHIIKSIKTFIDQY